MPKKKPKTPEYTLRAIKKYQKSLSQNMIRMPFSLKEKADIARGSQSMNAYVIDLIKADIEKKGIDQEQ